jgi:hypothetical protein
MLVTNNHRNRSTGQLLNCATVSVGEVVVFRRNYCRANSDCKWRMSIGNIVFFLLVLLLRCQHAEGKATHSNVDITSECEKLWEDGILNISAGKYVLRNHTHPAPYDHTCFLMKARYNCAGKPANRSMELWKFVVPTPDSRTECNVDTMVNNTGGVGQLARNIQTWSHRRSERVRYTNVLITGSSYMRQMHEALACRYSHLIVRGLVQLNASLSSLDDFGSIVPMPLPSSGLSCRAANSSHFFIAGVAPPRLLDETCQDSLGMVEYAGGLRVFYMFRQYLYDSALDQIFSALGLSPVDVDVLVTNYDATFNAGILQRVYPEVAVLQFDRVLPFFFKIQQKDCGWSDRAKNPGLPKDKQDGHPCMPGIPDDELDVLLLALAHGVKAIETGLPAHCVRCAELGYNVGLAKAHRVNANETTLPAPCARCAEYGYNVGPGQTVPKLLGSNGTAGPGKQLKDHPEGPVHRLVRT